MKRLFRLINLYWLSLFVLLLIFTFTVPPFQKPDEPKHFYRAMSIYYNEWKRSFDLKKSEYYIPLPTSIVSFPNNMHVSGILMHSDVKFPIGLYKQVYPWRFDKTLVNEPTSWPLPGVAYISYLPGIILSIPFDNLLVTFFLMRLSSALFFFFVVFLCWKLLPKRYSIFFLFFAMTPMILHQVTAISYDAPSIIFGMLLFSLFLWLIEKRKVIFLQLGLLLVITLFFNAVKSGYYATFVLPGIVLWRFISRTKISRTKQNLIFALILVVVSFLSYPLISQQLSLANLNYGKQIILTDPYYFIHAFAFTPFSDQYFWIHGLVGTFGWLDYKVPYMFIVLYFVSLGIIFYHMLSRDKKQLSVVESLLVLFIPLVTYVLIIYKFLQYETPSGYPTAQSIQGRYFLVVIPCIVYGLSQLYANVPRLIKTLGIMFGIVITTGVIVGSIYFRYYDYSKTIANFPDLQKQIENEEILFDNSPLQIASTSTSIHMVEASRKISGFQLVTAPAAIPVDIPYRYTILTSNCKKTIDTGLVDTTLLQKQGVVTIYTKVFQTNENTVCLTLAPAIKYISVPAYWSIETSHSLPVGQFLYISQ